MKTKDMELLLEIAHRESNKDFLANLTVTDYPNMKSNDRSKLHRDVYKLAYPEAFEQRIVRTDDLKEV